MGKRERSKSYPPALVPPRDHYGAGTRAARQRRVGRPYAPGAMERAPAKVPSPFLAQHIVQEVLAPEGKSSRHRTGSAAYLAVRDSTTEILGTVGLFDLRV